MKLTTWLVFVILVLLAWIGLLASFIFSGPVDPGGWLAAVVCTVMLWLVFPWIEHP